MRRRLPFGSFANSCLVWLGDDSGVFKSNINSAAVEKEFLDYCAEEGNNKKGGGRRSDESTAIEGSASMLQPRYIRAAWDLNADE